MKYIVCSIITTLVLLCSTLSYADSLKEALSYAYINNPELNAERERVKAVDEEVTQAHSGWLPNINFDFETGTERVEIATAPEDTEDLYSRTFSFTQPVFEGFNTTFSTKKARNLVGAAQAALHDKEQTIFMNVMTAYMQVVENNEILSLRKKNEEVLRKNLDATQDKFILGSTTKTDVAQAKARLSVASAERIKAEGNVNSAIASYRRIVGKEPKNIRMPKMLPIIPKTIREATNIALDNNPVLINAFFNQEAADNDIDISKSSLYPNVNIVSSSLRSEGASTFGNNGETAVDEIKLTLSIPLYQSGAEYSKVRQAKNTASQRKLEMAEIRNQIIEIIAQRWNNIKISRANIKSSIETVNAASIALEGVKEEAEYGKRTVLDVLDAEQELFGAEVEFVQNTRAEVESVYALRAAMGKLTAVDLNLNIAVYDPNEHLEEVEYKMFGF